MLMQKESVMLADVQPAQGKSQDFSKKSKKSRKSQKAKLKLKNVSSITPLKVRKKNCNILVEKDERPGMQTPKQSSLTVSIVPTQPLSEALSVGKIEKGEKSVPISKAKKDEILEALSLQTRLAKKVAKNTEDRKKATSVAAGAPVADEMTCQNPTAERVDYIGFIDQHYNRLVSGVHKIRYTKGDFDSIIHEASTIFASEKTLIDIDPPCVVVGDLHGQFNDLINMFILLGRPPNVVYVFTGDYVDRGMMGLECIMLLFAYKICYPENIYLLRGNHEIARVNKKYGFYEECITSIPKHGEEVWAQFQRCFNNLPISALIANKILCMHGGLSPSLVSLDELRNHPKPIRNPFRGIVNDMLWADPDLSVFEWKTSSRGSGFIFGTNVIHDVCARLGIELIIRAHQMCFDGYWTISGRKLITIFSAPMYCNLYKNAGCVLKIDSKLCIQMVAFVPESPVIEKIIKEKNRVWDSSVDNIEF